MINKVLIPIFLLSLLVLSACNNDGGRAKMLKQIESLELSEGKLTPEERIELMKLYESFANTFPGDSISGGFLARTISYNEAAGNYDVSISLGQRFIELMGDHPSTREVYISMGKAYNQRAQPDSAIKYFEWAQNIDVLDNSHLIELGHAYTSAAVDSTVKGREDMLIKAANIKVATGYLDEAFAQYDTFVRQFRPSSLAPYAMMRQVDILESQGKLKEAEKILLKLMAYYPESNFANDAKIILNKKLLGKTDEEKFAIITQSTVTR